MMRSCRSSSWFCHSCFNAKNIQKQVKVEKTIIKHPFGNGSHHLFMMIWGMVYIIVLPLLNADFMKLRLQVSTPLFFFYNPHKFLRVRPLPPPCWGESAGCSGFPPPDRETGAGAHRRCRGRGEGDRGTTPRRRAGWRWFILLCYPYQTDFMKLRLQVSTPLFWFPRRWLS